MKRCAALLAYACEDTTLSIDCDDDVIHVINANYGRLGRQICPENIGAGNIECVDSEARSVVKWT